MTNVAVSAIAENESHVPNAAHPSHGSAQPQPLPDSAYELQPSTRRIVTFFLLGEVVFLAVVAAYVWWGFSQWQKIW